MKVAYSFENIHTVFLRGSTALTGLGLLIDDVSGSHSDTSHFVGLLWAGRRDHCQEKHNRLSYMPPVGFETAIPASERPQTHALDRPRVRITAHYIYDPRLIATDSHPKSEHPAYCYYWLQEIDVWKYNTPSSFLWRCGPTRATASLLLRFLDHTQRHTTVSRTPLNEWSSRRRNLYLTNHNTHNRQTSMSPAGFEPTNPASERPRTLTFDRVATGIAI